MTDERPAGMSTAVKVTLIVVAVSGLLFCATIGGLSWIVGRNVKRYSGRAAVETTRVQMESIASAIQAYRLTHRRLPPDLDALVGPDGFLVTDEVPQDAWGNPFLYEPRDDGRSHTLISFGSDGVAGGEGDAADISIEDLHGR